MKFQNVSSVINNISIKYFRGPLYMKSSTSSENIENMEIFENITWRWMLVYLVDG